MLRSRRVSLSSLSSSLMLCALALHAGCALTSDADRGNEFEDTSRVSEPIRNPTAVAS